MLDTTNDNTSYPNPFPPLSDKLSFRVAERPIGWFNERTREHVRITKQKAIVREAAGGGTWLSNVGENYKLVLNDDLFPYIEKHFIDHIEPKYLQNVTVNEHTSYNGRDCYREYVFNDMKCDVRSGDVAYRAIVGNSYGSKSVTLLSGAIDFWCSNGMIVGQSEKQARKHTSGFQMTGITSWIDDSLRQFASHGARIRQYEDTVIDLTKEDGLFDYLIDKGLLSGQRANEARHAMHTERNKRAGRDTRPNMWHLYSALTDWATHSAVRDTGNDHEANTRIQRQQSVERVIRGAERFLEAA